MSPPRGDVSWPVWLLIGPIRGYQRWISPALGQHCRFAPSCSSYAVGALQQHGALRGSWLAARRLLRCHPWNAGGYDPLPGAGDDRLPGAGDDALPGAGDDPHPTPIALSTKMSG